MINLEEGKKNNPFKVPDNYFDTLQNEVMKNVKEDHLLWIKQSNRKRFIATAAAIVSLIIITTFSISLHHSKTENLIVENQTIQNTTPINEENIVVPTVLENDNEEVIIPDSPAQTVTNPSKKSESKGTSNNKVNHSKDKSIAQNNIDNKEPIETITYTLINSYEEDLTEEYLYDLVYIYDFCYDY